MKGVAPTVPIVLVMLQAAVHSFLQPLPSRKQFSSYSNRNLDVEEAQGTYSYRWMKGSGYSLRLNLIDDDLNTPTIIPERIPNVSLNVRSTSNSKSDEGVVTGTRQGQDNLTGWSVLKDAIYNLLDSWGQGNRKAGKDGAASSENCKVVDGYRDKVEKSILESPSIRVALESQQGSSITDAMLTPGVRLLRQFEESLQRESPDNDDSSSNIFKETLYATIDGIEKTGERVMRLPETCEKLLEKIEDSIDETSEKVQNVVEDVTAIPERIQSAAQSMKDAADETVRITTVVAQDIQNIPEAIQENILQTSMKMDQTKESINQAVQQVQDLTFKTKVFVGLEKPIPLPPPPPPMPKPKSNQQVALEIAGSFLATGGKVAWFLGKGLVFLGKGLVSVGVTAANIGWSLYQDSKRKQEERESLSKTSESAVVVEIPSLKTPTSLKQIDQKFEMEESDKSISLAQIDPLLDRQVSEALRLASEALSQSAIPQSNKPASLKQIGPKFEMEDKPISLAQIDPLLGREISEALRLESLALSQSAALDKKKKRKRDFTNRSAELDKALVSAKAAAAQAVSDAAELEKIVKRLEKVCY
jgi:archaellum component FlaC